MKVIILAGGKATRLPNSTKDIPKPLVPILGATTILEHQIEGLARHGLTDIRLSLHHRADQIVAWITEYARRAGQPFAFDCVIESQPLGTGGAIKFASRDLREPFLVLNGDIVADFNFGVVAAKAHNPGDNIVVGRQFGNASDMGTIKHDSRGRIHAFIEKTGIPEPGVINAGFYLLQPGVFKGTPEAFSIEHEIFPKLAAAGNLHTVLHEGAYWFDCGTEERLEEVRDFFSGLKRK